MKHAHRQYIELVHAGPRGLFSQGDLGRLDAHVDDGRVGAQVVARVQPATVVDVGSGGGVPAVQLAIELGDSVITAVESQQWKADFLLTCARALDLESRLRVAAMRAEDAVGQLGREVFDVGTARALAVPLVVAEYLAPLVRVGGHLMLWSTRTQARAGGALGPVGELGLGEPVLHAAPSSLRTDGVIIVWPKVDACSDRFPRRVGVAAKRPLRAATHS